MLRQAAPIVGNIKNKTTWIYKLWGVSELAFPIIILPTDGHARHGDGIGVLNGIRVIRGNLQVDDAVGTDLYKFCLQILKCIG